MGQFDAERWCTIVYGEKETRQYLGFKFVQAVSISDAIKKGKTSYNGQTVVEDILDILYNGNEKPQSCMANFNG